MRPWPWLSPFVLLLAVPATAEEPPTTQAVERAPPPLGEPAASQPAAEAPPFTPEQLQWLEKHVLAKQPRYELHFDVFMKGLYKNDQSNGSVWLGNPHPEGDNYSGSNGMAAVLGIRIDGHVTDTLSAGARLETRFGMLFSDFYENGDLAVGANGRPSGVNATGESLGMNHAAYAQLRGIYIQWDQPPVPTIASLRAGSSDLSLWNPWTVGKIRFIDRDNAKGLFILGAAPSVGIEYNIARVALPKLYASAGFNTGIADALVQNPFWGRDAVYVGKLGYHQDRISAQLIGSWLIDEEADLNDPDALGSTNLIDHKDGVVTTLARYQNWNATLEGQYKGDGLFGHLLLGVSRSEPNLRYATNTIDDNQGLSPIPLTAVTGYAVRARFEATKLLPWLELRGEYFNIGADWVATMGARREEDVLLTEGFLDGQLATLNIANEFIDFTEPFYETIVGWHGGTIKPKLLLGPVDLELEATVIGYNTNAQGRCTSKRVPGCETVGGVYPDFLFPDGMTDTDFFTFANTNDRGRDPRAAYRTNQNRVTYLGFARGGVDFGPDDRGRIQAAVRFIHDKDLRDTRIPGDDDYAGDILTASAQASYKIGEHASVAGGAKLDHWNEKHRSGAIVAGTPHYPDYVTNKSKFWLEARYQFPAGAFLSYRIELLNKDVATSEPALDYQYRNIVRSIASLYAGF